MTFERLTALSLAALLAACAGEGTPTDPTSPDFAVGTGHNAADHIVGTQPVAFTVVNPCNGESIPFTGIGEYKTTAVATEEDLQNGFYLHNPFWMRVTATGVGSVTGATYTMNQISQNSFNSPSPTAPQFTASLLVTAWVSSSVDELEFKQRYNIHVIMPASADQPKFTTNVVDATCTG